METRTALPTAVLGLAAVLFVLVSPTYATDKDPPPEKAPPRKLDPAIREKLTKQLAEAEDPKVRRGAAEELGLSGDPTAAPTLAAALEDKDRSVACTAAVGLMNLGGLELLANALSHSRPHKELAVALPQAAAAVAARARPTTVIIEIAADGTVFFEHQPVTNQLLQKKLREAAAQGKDCPVRIDADRRTPFQHIVHVLDFCQFEGLKNVGFRTRE